MVAPTLFVKVRAVPAADAPLVSGSSANLDFLRAFAVLLVLIRHLMTAHSAGDSRWVSPQAIGIFGVLLFFVHTSLVLMFSLERQQEKLGSRHLYTTFLVRRVFRIYPLSACVVLLVALGSALWPMMMRPPDALTSHAGLAAVLSNLFLIQDLTHYADSIGPLWSLPLEMQMYFLLPLLFLNAKKLGVGGMLVLWGLSLVLAVIRATHPALPNILAYTQCFLPGVLCYVLVRQRPAPRFVLPFWTFPLLLCFLLAAYELAYGRFHHGQASLGAPACLALGLLLPRFQEMPGAWLRLACKTIARYSYGIYLLHMPVIWFAFTCLHTAPLAVQCLVFVFGLVTLPVLAYHGIEEPAIKLGNRLAGYIHRSRLTPQP